MEIGQASSSNASSAPSTTIVANSQDVKRPDKVHPYRVNFWADILSEDGTSEIMNVLAMILSMLGMVLKYKVCSWIGTLVAAVSFANARSNLDGKQVMSTFMLSISSVVMCYLTNPLPISISLSQQQLQQGAAIASAPLDSSTNPAAGASSTVQ